MTTWTKQKLGDLITIKHGYAFKGEFFCDYLSPNILLTPGNFAIGGGFQMNKPKFYDGPLLKDYLLEAGDLVVTMTDLSKEGDTLGYPAIIPDEKNINFLHNQRIGLISKKNINVDLNFLYYLMRIRRYQKFIVGSASGSTVHHTSPNRIYEYLADIPDLDTQTSIASVLFAYENLIENNEKRVKILEEMSQRLYTEWFVKFKFPGHEKVKMIDSKTEFGMIPEGWEVKKLGDILELAYGKGLISSDRNEGLYPVYGSSGKVGTHTEKLVLGPGIVVGRKGNVGSIFWVDEDFYPIDTTFYIKTSFEIEYVYYLLKSQTFEGGDAAVPGLNRGYAYGKQVLIPLQNLRLKFSTKVSWHFKIINNIKNQNLNLTKIRDLLIPQLVTGKREIKYAA